MEISNVWCGASAARQLPFSAVGWTRHRPEEDRLGDRGRLMFASDKNKLLLALRSRTQAALVPQASMQAT